MYFGENIKFLRKRLKRTQDDIAFSLNMKRSTLSGYENGVAEPSLEKLVQFSEYFKIPVDALIKTNISKMSDLDIQQVEAGSPAYVSGSHLRILSRTISTENEENIELVNERAKAGYTRGFADPGFIRVLPTFQLPFLSKEKKYRSFQISGESMRPIPDGAYITGEFIQNWYSLKDGDACIVLTLDDGIVFKCIENKLKSDKKLGLYSLNPEYKPYHIDAEDIKEIWKFVHYISPQMPEAIPEQAELHHAIANLRDDVNALKKEIGRQKTSK